MAGDTPLDDEPRIFAVCTSRTCSWRGEDREAPLVRGVARCPSCHTPVGFVADTDVPPPPGAQVINFPAPTDGAAAAAPAGAADQLPAAPPPVPLRDAAQRLVLQAQPLFLNQALSLVGTKFVDELRAALAGAVEDERVQGSGATPEDASSP